MFYLIIIIFVLGYAAIAFEEQISVDKAATALITGILLWVCIAFVSDRIHGELLKHLGEISEILFFLLGAMTIVSTIDSHGCFNMFSKIIKTTNKVKLLWIFSFITFFMAAMMSNLTATIVTIAMINKLIGGKNTRWFFASMMVLAANAGGAWSPIGDVTTIMLWIGGQVTALSIITKVFLPSLVCLLVPLMIVSFILPGEIIPPSRSDREKSKVETTERERWIVLLTGILGLLCVPIFRFFTDLPPYMGIMLVLAILWTVTEILHHNKQKKIKARLSIAGGILKKIDMPTIFFFLGILLAVAALQTGGHLYLVGLFLDEKISDVYAINIIIGALSSVVDNVPLVAGAMGMYEIVSPDKLILISDPMKLEYLKNFMVDGDFWKLLAYCAGTGGSILIIGSAAGVAAMGMAQINFLWFLKKISWLAIIGYLSGIVAYFLL